MKGKYTLFAFTGWCIVYTLLFTFILPLITLNLLENAEYSGTFFFWIIFGIESLIGFFLARQFGLRKIEIWFDKDQLLFRSYGLISLRIRKTGRINFSEITRFDDFAFGGDYKFKIILKNTSELTMYKSKIWNFKDDFERLISDFKILIKSPGLVGGWNSGEAEKITSIEYDDFFDRPIARLIYFVSIFLLVTISTVILTQQIEFRPATLIVFGSLTGYISTYLVKRRNFR